MKNLSFFFLICLGLIVTPGTLAEINAPDDITGGQDLFLSGVTNFNTDNKVLIEIYPATFGPTEKYEPEMTGGGSQVVPVMRDDDGTFYWKAVFPTSGWSPDSYMVRIEVIGKDYRETSLITLVEAKETSVITPEVTVAEPEITPEKTEMSEENLNNQTIPEKTNKAVSLPLLIILAGVAAGMFLFSSGHQR